MTHEEILKSLHRIYVEVVEAKEAATDLDDKVLLDRVSCEIATARERVKRNAELFAANREG